MYKKIIMSAIGILSMSLMAAYESINLEKQKQSIVGSGSAKIVQVDVIDSITNGTIKIDIERNGTVLEPSYKTEVTSANTNRLSNKWMEITSISTNGFSNIPTNLILYCQSSGYYRNGNYELTFKDLGTGYKSWTISRFSYSNNLQKVSTVLAEVRSQSILEDDSVIQFSHFEEEWETEEEQLHKITFTKRTYEEMVFDNFVYLNTYLAGYNETNVSRTINLVNQTYDTGVKSITLDTPLYINSDDIIKVSNFRKAQRTKEVRIILER